MAPKWTCSHVLWPNMVKIGLWGVDKMSSGLLTNRLRETRPSPACCPHNFLDVVVLDLCIFAKFGPGWLRFAGVVPKHCFFGSPKSITIWAERLLWLAAYNYAADCFTACKFGRNKITFLKF